MKKTVLIVDDVAFVRKTLADILIEAGYTVIAEAADGKEAVEMYLKHRPSLVTMDVVMPNFTGIDATKEIMKADRNAVVVMISAMDQIHLVMEAIHVGAKDYIQKPFHSEDVRNVLARAIHGETVEPALAAPRAG